MSGPATAWWGKSWQNRFKTIIGVDIIEEAAEATLRDRPGIYDDYFIEDLTALPEKVEQKIIDKNPSCMSIVAALGFDDIPPEAFASAYNLITEDGWVAFNIKDEFLQDNHPSGFSKLIEEMVASDIMDIVENERYQHRLCLDGTPLNYYAVVGKNRNPFPIPSWSNFSNPSCIADKTECASCPKYNTKGRKPDDKRCDHISTPVESV